MSQYTVSKYNLDEIDKLKAVWEDLYTGADMTYHQSYSWYKMISRFTPVTDGVETGFYVVEDEGEPVMIAPLWIITRRIKVVNAPGIYLMGRKMYTDYLNFIYKDFDPSAFDALVKWMIKKYGKLLWYFELIKESSQMYKYITRLPDDYKCTYETVSRTVCAAIPLPATKEEYWQTLKKSMRERLHRIENRCAKDGEEYVVCFDEPTHVQQCIKCYDTRNQALKLREKERMSRMGRLYFSIKDFFTSRYQIKFPKYTPLVEADDVSLISVLHKASGAVVAFASYSVDKEHDKVQVIQIAYDENHSRYSPGMLCARALIEKSIADYGAKEIDFTRGDEKYKYDLGGKTHMLSNLIVKFSRNKFR